MVGCSSEVHVFLEGRLLDRRPEAVDASKARASISLVEERARLLTDRVGSQLMGLTGRSYR
jgi:hypothetical protein